MIALRGGAPGSGMGKAGRTGDSRCSAVRWPGLGANSHWLPSDPGQVTLTLPGLGFLSHEMETAPTPTVGLPSLRQATTPSVLQAFTPTLGPNFPGIIRVSRTAPTSGTHGASSVPRLPPFRDRFSFTTGAKHTPDTQQALNEHSTTQRMIANTPNPRRTDLHTCRCIPNTLLPHPTPSCPGRRWNEVLGRAAWEGAGVWAWAVGGGGAGRAGVAGTGAGTGEGQAVTAAQ